MKRPFLLGLMTVFSLSIFAQQNAIDKYFKTHYDNPAFDKFEVTEKTFDLVAEMETEDAEEQRVLTALANIEGIKVLANKETAIGLEYYQEAMDKLIPDAAYEDLVVVETEGNHVRFMIRENEEGIQEFVAVVQADQSFVIASLHGTIDVASLSKMMEVMKNGGGEWLGNFNNLHSEEIIIGQPTVQQENSSTLSKVSINDISLNIYPNPATDYINIATEKGVASKMKVGFYSLLGKEIQTVGEVDLPYKMDLKTLPGGTYFLRITDESGTYKNFKVVKPASTNN